MKKGTVAKILLLLMVMQVWSLWELSQTYNKWNTENFFKTLCHIICPLSLKEARASVNTIFGPTKYIRTTGKPNVYQDVKEHVNSPRNQA